MMPDANLPINLCSVPFESGTNEYLSLINKELAALGVHFEREGKGISSIERVLRPGLILHFHWPSTLYTRSTRAATELAVGEWLRLLSTAKLKGAKIVWTVHNLLPHDAQFLKAQVEARNALVQKADHLIAHCELAVSLIRKSFGKPKVATVIPHPSYPISAPRRRVRKGSDLSILVFGNLRPYKGIERFVTQFVKHARCRDTLIVAGEPYPTFDLSSLRRVCETDLRVSLRIGRIASSDFAKLFSEVDIAVFAFNNVLSSGSVALAQSYGIPVVVPRMGCLSEMVPPAVGEVYDCSLSDDVFEAIERIRGRNLALLGEAAKTLVDQVNSATFATRLLSVYGNLISQCSAER